MSLHIKMEQTSDVAVLQCCGRLVRGEALHLLKGAVTSLSRQRVVVLDLSEVEMLDGGGLGMLVFLHEWTRSSGIQLKLVNPSILALEMLMRTRLTSVLHVSSIDDVVGIFCNSHRPPDCEILSRPMHHSIELNWDDAVTRGCN